MSNNSFDPHNISGSWAIGAESPCFIDGNNLFTLHAFTTSTLTTNKLLRVLLGDGRLLRAFFYTGWMSSPERQQGFLLWMRRNGFRVIQKELKILLRRHPQGQSGR